MKSIKKEYSDRIEYRNEQGYLHREDGPATEWFDGAKFWYLYGIIYTEHDWQQELAKIKLKRILDL
jgi:hypothetical protein